MFKRKPTPIVTMVKVWETLGGDPFILDSGPSFDRFKTLWTAKEKTDLVPQSEWLEDVVSIDVSTGDQSQRWIYHRSGKVWVLTKTTTPVYLVDVEINETLGLNE